VDDASTTHHEPSSRETVDEKSVIHPTDYAILRHSGVNIASAPAENRRSPCWQVH